MGAITSNAVRVLVTIFSTACLTTSATSFPGSTTLCPAMEEPLTPHCTCRKRRQSGLGPPPPVRRGCSNLFLLRGGVPRIQNLSRPPPPPSPGGSPGLSKAQSFSACSWSEYSFGRCACLRGFYTDLVSASPAHSTSFAPNFSKCPTVGCVQSSESEFYLW